MLASLSNTYVHSSDEFELEFFSLSQAMKVTSQAKLGHFNLQSETELKILTICMSKNGKFLTYFPILRQYHDSNQFHVHLCSTKGVFRIDLCDLGT